MGVDGVYPLFFVSRPRGTKILCMSQAFFHPWVFLEEEGVLSKQSSPISLVYCIPRDVGSVVIIDVGFYVTGQYSDFGGGIFSFLKVPLDILVRGRMFFL